jgi:NitT/TauT family transport system substrate-binding protein
MVMSLSASAFAADKVRLTLDWKPEPEFGGFYAACEQGAFAKHDLDVDLKPAGEGAPTWQLVATGKTEFATTAADQVMIARRQGADVVALFAVYQTFPQGIMVHKARGFSRIDDVFNNPGVLAAEDDTWLHFLRNKFPSPQVKIIGYAGGIGGFLARPDYSQQCFITSEPLLAARQGGDPQTFLIANAGYNPYTTVLIARGDDVRGKADLIARLTAACREGWRAYLDDPKPANAVMADLNHDMDPQTFADAAAAQKPLIETDETKANGLGTMTKARWDALGRQLVELNVIDQAPKAEECFVNPK